MALYWWRKSKAATSNRKRAKYYQNALRYAKGKAKLVIAGLRTLQLIGG